MISILLDQGLAPRAAALLGNFGIDAKHVSEIGMAEAEELRFSMLLAARVACVLRSTMIFTRTLPLPGKAAFL